MVADGGGRRLAVVQRWRTEAVGSLVVEGNQWWVAVGDNTANLVFLQEKIFSSHENIVIPYVR